MRIYNIREFQNILLLVVDGGIDILKELLFRFKALLKFFFCHNIAFTQENTLNLSNRTAPTDFTLINGTCSIDRYFSINMTKESYEGIFYTLKVTSLKGNILEGEFTDRGRNQRYTIRMKRTEK